MTLTDKLRFLILFPLAGFALGWVLELQAKW